MIEKMLNFHKEKALASDLTIEYDGPPKWIFDMEKKYCIIAFYCYAFIENPKREMKRQKRFLEDLDAKARIYVANNGINAQISLSKEDAPIYMEWLKSDPQFASVHFKIDPYHEHAFPRITVKYREQLVALDQMPDLKNGGEHISPEKWEKMLQERDENTLLVDVRNEYESKIGHFEGAECPPLKTFRQFPEYAEQLAKTKDPKKTKVMMYCTGGIRCETYSALLKEKGFEQVYQLEGGVIHYGHQMGNKRWKGKLFVFDDRLSAPISEDEHELISTCSFCEKKSDAYYNCANMDCNELYLSCPDCAEKLMGCCSQECLKSERRRPFVKQERPKPFRKWYNYSKSKARIDYDKCCSCAD